MALLIYAAVALLVVWSAAYLIRHVRRQLQGGCGCGPGCGGDCFACRRDCGHR